MTTILSSTDDLWDSQWKSELHKFLDADTKQSGEEPKIMSDKCPYCGEEVSIEDFKERFFMGKICNQCFRKRLRSRKAATDLAKQCLKNLYYIYGIKPWKKIKVKVKFRWWALKDHKFPIHDADVKYRKRKWKYFSDKLSFARGVPVSTAERAAVKKLLEQYLEYQLSKSEAAVKKAEKAEKKARAAKQKAEKEEEKAKAAKQKAEKVKRKAEAARWRAEKEEKKAEKEEKKIETAKKEIEKAEKEIEKTQKEIEEKKQEIENAQKEIEEKKQEIENAQKETEKEEGAVAAIQEIEGAEKEIEGAEKEIEGAEKEIERAEKEIRKIDDRVRKANKEVKKAEKEAERAEKEVEKAEKKVRKAEMKAEAAEKKAEAVKKEAGAVGSKKKESKGLCIWCTIHYLYIVKSREHARRYEEALPQEDKEGYRYWQQNGLGTPMNYNYLKLEQVMNSSI